MFEAVMHSDACDRVAHHAALRTVPRTRTAPDDGPWLGAVLDEVDYAMLLVGARGELMYANEAARSGLSRGGPLWLREGRVAARREADEAALVRALADAVGRGARCMLALGDEPARVRVAVVPLGDAIPGSMAPTLLMLGRATVCEELSIQCFARSHRLTPAETQALVRLCRGDSPAAIARRQGVALSTVRSHVGSIRAKTGAASIRALCEQVALLPPMVCALRTPHAVPLS